MTHAVTYTGKRTDGAYGAESSKGYPSLEQKDPKNTGKQYFQRF